MATHAQGVERPSLEEQTLQLAARIEQEQPYNQHILQSWVERAIDTGCWQWLYNLLEQMSRTAPKGHKNKQSDWMPRAHEAGWK